MKKRKQYTVARPEYIGFYATKEEREIIVRGAQRSGKSISAYLRDLARQDDRDSQIKIPRKRVAEYV